MDVAAIGDCCIDSYIELKKIYAGGNSVNFGVHIKRLGANVSYVGPVGTDKNGKFMIESIKKEGINTSRISIIDGKTPITNIKLIDNDRVFIDYDEGVLKEYKLRDRDIDFIKKHKIVHAGYFGHMERYLKSFKDYGMIVSFDFADEWNDDVISNIAPNINYGFLSYASEDDNIENLLRKVHSHGLDVIIATLGKGGSIAYDGNKFYRHGIIPVEVVDTLGAGDSFIAGYMYGVLKNATIKESLEIGSKSAAKTITYFGGW